MTFDLSLRAMVRGGPANRAVKRAKIFALTKGFRGRAKNCYSIAVRAAHKALQHAYRGRRLKKRDMRKLWIQRINFAAKEHKISYSKFMYNLVKCNVQLNRKVLSELAIHEPKTFQALTDIAKKRQRMGLLSALSDDTIQSYQSQSRGRTVAAKQQHQTAVSSKLYETNIVVDESGRRVKETAV